MVKDIKGANRTITSDDWFPRLKHDKKFKVTSNYSFSFNCIAWAMRLGDRWVDTKVSAGHWWPIEITKTSSQKEELVRAFEALKFVKCDDPKREFWYDKVSLYYNPFLNIWTHAARVLSPNEYHSKLGEGWDIHHSQGGVLHNPKDIANSYGKEFQLMKRHKFLRFYSLWLILVRLFDSVCDSINGLV